MTNLAFYLAPKGDFYSSFPAVLHNEELYGYQIVKAISQQSDALLEFGEGSIYPALHALEQAGYLSSRWVEQTNLPDRKYYRLTRKGNRLAWIPWIGPVLYYPSSLVLAYMN